MYHSFITKVLGMPFLAAEQGGKVDLLIGLVHLLMLALFIGWLSYFLYVIFRFNKKRNPKADPVGIRSHASSYIEGLVALVEAVLLIGFAIPIWAMNVDKFPDAKDSLLINVIGRQFNWTGRYPGPDGVFGRQDVGLVTNENPFGIDSEDPTSADDVTVVGEIVVPVNENIIVNITSMDVIHCFALKHMRVTQDAIPGMKIATWFKPIREGDYRITCAQLCGNSHYAMAGTLKVVSKPAFDEWLLAKIPTPQSADEAADFATESDYE